MMAGTGRALDTIQSIVVVSPAMTVMVSSMGLSEICGNAATTTKNTTPQTS